MLERTQGPVFVKPELLRDQRKGWEDGWAVVESRDGL